MKKKIQSVIAFSVLFAFLVFTLGFSSVKLAIPVNNVGVYTPVVIVDAGHGGVDDGATSRDGTIEKDINLSIALNFRDMLISTGFEVVMIREGDYSIHDDDANTIRKKKMTDLHNRLSIVNSTKDAVLISIHQNIFAISKYSGAQVFYSPNNPLSHIMADTFQSKIIELLQPSNNRVTKPCTSDIFLLYNATPPAILVECGFLSNQSDAALLRTPEYQQRFAFVLLCALLNYCEQTS